MLILKKNILSLAISCCLSISYAQLPKPDLPTIFTELPKPVEEFYFKYSEFIPEFPEGNVEFKKYLFSKLRHPKSILKLIKAGKLTLEFRINNCGILNQLIIKGTLKSCFKNDLTKVFSTFPSFRIGRSAGFPKDYWFRINGELMPEVEKEKAKNYLILSAGTYLVFNFDNR